MSQLFAITAASDQIAANSDGIAEASFTVTNNADHSVRVIFKVRPLQGVKSEWLSILDGPERDLGGKKTEHVTVKVTLPPGTAPGTHTFRLDVVSVENPDDDYTEGPIIALKVGPPIVVKPFPWWKLIAACAALVVIAVAAWLLVPRNVEVPVVIEVSLEEAEKLLAEKGLVSEILSRDIAPVEKETVIKQDPEKGQVRRGSTVKLTVGIPPEPFDMPDYVTLGTHIRDAEEFLATKLVFLQTSTQATRDAAQGTIVEQSIPPGTRVELLDNLTLTVAVPLTPFDLPDLRTKHRDQAKSELSTLGLLADVREAEDPSKAHEIVFDQVPPPGSKVRAGDSVQLYVAYTMAVVPEVRGRLWRDAQTQIRVAGLSLVRVHGNCTAPVTEQWPLPGERHRKNQEMALITPGDRNKICFSPAPFSLRPGVLERTRIFNK